MHLRFKSQWRKIINLGLWLMISKKLSQLKELKKKRRENRTKTIYSRAMIHN